MKLKLHVWRQKDRNSPGQMVSYDADHVSPDMSFLEMLDVVNQDLINKGDEPIHFDHDCREGICGMCSLVINGTLTDLSDRQRPASSTCGSSTTATKFTLSRGEQRAFPVIKDLMVDRSSFDRIIQEGGYISVNTGNAPDAHAIPIGKPVADEAFEAAACIGCGACVASCKNASAMLFVSAKVAQLSMLPQGQAERKSRVQNMVNQMDEEGFGSCTNHGECEAVCPKDIKVKYIAELNKEYRNASFS